MGMMINRRLSFTVSLLVILSLTAGIIPSVYVSSDTMALSFDVWTNKGGKGPIAPGGTFQVGEDTVIYATATADVQARWTISGPSMSDQGTVAMLANKTYIFEMGEALQQDIGQWTVTFEGELYKNGVPYQGAMDKVSFTVVAAGTQATTPETSQAPAAAPARMIDEDGALETDALTAIKMADGDIPPSGEYDVDNDGEVTEIDAMQIMNWAVSGVYQGLPSVEQTEVIDVFGPPDQFAVWYDLDDDIAMDFLVRNEVWYYPDYESCITFVAGSICDAGAYAPPENETSYPNLRPWDFDGFMTYDQVMEKIGEKSADTLDLLPESLQEDGFTAYAASPAVFIIEGGQLAYIQTIVVDTIPGSIGPGEAGYQSPSIIFTQDEAAED